jgi:DNA-binding NtrC family response regulator
MMNRMAEDYGRPPLPFSPKLLEACMNEPWPGNVRELGNFVKRYIILGDESLALDELHARDRERSYQSTLAKPAAEPAGDLKSMVRGLKDDAEAEAITRALQQTNWNRKKAAEVLNISYKALLYKVRQYNIAPPRAKSNLRYVDR